MSLPLSSRGTRGSWVELRLLEDLDVLDARRAKHDILLGVVLDN